MENITIVIKGCAKKEHKYQSIVYERYYGYALKIVFRYIYRYEKAVFVTNDGFVKLFRHFEHFKPGKTDLDNEKILMGFIRRIMINTAIDELRKGTMSPEIGGIPDYVWDITAKDQDADQLLLYKEMITMVKDLPPKYRVVFNMYVIDGYNHLEIADMINISVGTSKSCLSRARAMLQENIKKIEDSKICSV
ncbi:MAG TPA: RNA polymerase sigma factor [Agriterribacter sp.]|nr:RNA polymerase sigma factor [Agriterribacter sp.]